MSTEICIVLLEGTFTLIAALLTAWFALFFYHKQKEYELVKQRYLDGSVDVIASEIDDSLGVFNHNWARCLNVLKKYRDMEQDFDIKDLDIGFIDYEARHFHQIAHYRLHALTGSLCYWHMYQKIMAFVTNNIAIMQHEIPDTIKTKLTSEAIEADHQIIVEDAFKLLRKIQKKSHEFAHFSEELHTIAAILEQEKLSVKKVKDFKEKDEIKNSINNINTRYKEYLADSNDEYA